MLDKETQILVVDDFAAMRKIMTVRLRGLGYHHVTEACDAAEAMKLLAQRRFGMIICDWTMPGMTGLDLLRWVRSQPQLAGVPFLMVTAEGKKTNILEAIRAGVTNYVVKPFSAEILLEKMVRIDAA